MQNAISNIQLISNKTTEFVRFFVLVLVLIIAQTANCGEVESNNDRIRVAYFSQDPPSIDSLSPAFDPDSYSVIAQIFDSLIYMDLKGNFQPGLAISWKQLSPTQWQFDLRQGVKFHNGEVFDAKAVKFTFDYILNPKNNAGNRWIFNTLKSVTVDPQSLYRVHFTTHQPDGMFLNRFNLFGSICPPNYIKQKGFKYFSENPIGTGPFKFKNWDKGRSVLLEKNENYWQKNLPNLNQVEFVMMPQNQWVKAFTENKVDLIPNLSGSKTKQLMTKSHQQARIIKTPVLISYWVLLKNQGPLKNLKFRQALNYAISRKDLIHFADFGNALPMSSLGKQGEFGANNTLSPFTYNPNKAKQLIKESGVTLPLKFKVLASDVSETAAKIIRKNLRDVGVELELEIVSRSEWTRRVVVYKLVEGKRPDFDMVINMVDNPIYNLAFHAGLFLESSSPWSLLNSEEFDKRFAEALSETDQQKHEEKLKQLDQYIQSQALMLFTTQRMLTAAVNKRFDIQQFGANGHLGYEVLSNAKIIDVKK